MTCVDGIDNHATDRSDGMAFFHMPTASPLASKTDYRRTSPCGRRPRTSIQRTTVKHRIPDISRRQLLASVGVAGFAGLGFRRTAVTGAPPAYTDYTYARTDDGGPRLRVAWYSTYNGRLLNSTPTTTDETLEELPSELADNVPPAEYVDEYDTETHGPLVAVSNALPGDSGTIAIGLIAEEMDARVRLFPTIAGALSEVVDFTFWYDTGPFGIGSCAGTDAIPSDPDLELTLAEFASRYGTDGLEIRHGTRDCLVEGERRCLGMAWRIDESVSNEWQGRGLEFDFVVTARQCGGLI